MKNEKKVYLSKLAKRVFYFGIIILLLSGCKNHMKMEGEDAYRMKGDNITCCYTPANEYSTEDWEQTKQVLKKRIEVFANGDSYDMDDLGNVLRVTADKEILSNKEEESNYIDFITSAFRKGLYDPDTYEFLAFKDGDIKSIQLVENKGKSQISIVLQDDLSEDVKNMIFRENVKFMLSYGTTGIEIPVQWDNINRKVMYLSQIIGLENSERRTLIEYHDMTNDNPAVMVHKVELHDVKWNESLKKGKNQCGRKELGNNITEFVFRYAEDEKISEEKFEEVADILMKRLDVIGYPYALGKNHDEREVRIAFGKKVPDELTMTLLGVNYVPAVRIGSREEDLNYQQVGLHLNGSDELVLDTSAYSNTILYNLTEDAQKHSGFVCVQLNDIPLGYTFTNTAIKNGQLIIGNTLLDNEDLKQILSLYEQKGEIPVELSCEESYVYEGEKLIDINFQRDSFNSYTGELIKSLRKEIPQLKTVSVEPDRGLLDYRLVIEPNDYLVDTYVKCINGILKKYPYRTFPFSNIQFSLCDEHNNNLYAVNVYCMPEYNSEEYAIFDLHIDRNQEVLDAYQEKLESALKVGVHYE